MGGIEPVQPLDQAAARDRGKGNAGIEAVARTTQYWYLRWWSTVEQRYRYPYRETNRQTYILVNASNGWLVEENIRPAPRSSTPHRQLK